MRALRVVGNTLWTHYEHIMDTLWTHYEHTMNTLWTHYEHIIKDYGHIMNTLWTHYEHIMNTLWARYEHTTNTLWTRCIHAQLSVVGNTLWTHHKGLWTHYEHNMNTLWTHYEHVAYAHSSMQEHPTWHCSMRALGVTVTSSPHLLISRSLLGFFVFCFTLQHEGFGRHGDILAPLADLQILASFFSLISPPYFFLLFVALRWAPLPLNFEATNPKPQPPNPGHEFVVHEFVAPNIQLVLYIVL